MGLSTCIYYAVVGQARQDITAAKLSDVLHSAKLSCSCTFFSERMRVSGWHPTIRKQCFKHLIAGNSAMTSLQDMREDTINLLETSFLYTHRRSLSLPLSHSLTHTTLRDTLCWTDCIVQAQNASSQACQVDAQEVVTRKWADWST